MCSCRRRRVPFLLPSLDQALGGGIVCGEGIVEISGPPGVGKTSLTLQLAVSLAAGYAQSTDCISPQTGTVPLSAGGRYHREFRISGDLPTARTGGGSDEATPKRGPDSTPKRRHHREISRTAGLDGNVGSSLGNCPDGSRKIGRPTASPSCMREELRGRLPQSRKTLFIDCEGGVRGQRVFQMVAGHFADHRACSSAATARAAMRAGHQEGLQTRGRVADSFLPGSSCGALSGNISKACGSAYGTDSDLAFVFSCIDVARVFDHQELLNLLQHVLLTLSDAAGISADAKPSACEHPSEEPQGPDSLEKNERSRNYSMIVVDSLSWIYHPAFFRSAADCTALLMQTVGILRYLSFKFGLAVVVTNQLTACWDSGGPVAADRGRYGNGNVRERVRSAGTLASVLGELTTFGL
ncbi:hypothetical protein CSUI_004340 [Cystoisospora suis]|uniref:Uncharacterized protein n=1 Tax=Cystoisospora suis TaxID=483139 RepID=A0A2C6L1D9_9APIC|nr:hypothetical protein CSUI_004340 [Cystoisospora suis]